MTLTLLLAQCEIATPPTPPPNTPDRIYEEKDGKPTKGPLTSDLPCKTEMWARTYGPMKRFGDLPAPDTPGYPYNRSTMHHRCVVVRGTVETIPAVEVDGDIKFQISVDPLTYLLNYYQRGDLVNASNTLAPDKVERWLPVELVCAAPLQLRPAGSGLNKASGKVEPYVRPNVWSPVTDHFCDECVTACEGYNYTGYRPKKNDVIDVTGERITDTGAAAGATGGPPRPAHGPAEIHPVTLIRSVRRYP